MMLYTLFWICSAIIIYVYIGYPGLLWVLNRVRVKRPLPAANGFEPTVSLIIAAHNEEKMIVGKIQNSFALDYPKGKLQIIVVSDGSTDRTAQLIQPYTKQVVQLIELPHNVGKAAAQNEAVDFAKGDVLFFTDANVSLQRDALRKMVRHFQFDKVGCVVGKVTYTNESDTCISEGEGFYWRYELFLRNEESELGNLVAGSGPIMAIRRTLFEPLDPDVSDDFVLPMKAAIRGYRTVYEPQAVSSERLFQVSTRDMLRTRVRTTILDTRSVFLCRTLLNPLRYPLYTWGIISHKLLRWLVPYFLIVIFIFNLLLLGQTFYRLSLVLQVTLYGLALSGLLWQEQGKPPQILGIPFSFCLVNAAALVGVAKFVIGKKKGQWEPVR